MDNIIKDEGFSSLYLGYKPRIIKIVLHCGIMLSCYELFINYFQNNLSKLTITN